MALIELPAIVVNPLDLRIGDLDKWDVLFKPRCVIAEILGGQCLDRQDVRCTIPEKKQKGRRNWAGKQAEQQAVYANRRRVRGEYGKSLLRRRGEFVERSFAHCYETGGCGAAICADTKTF